MFHFYLFFGFHQKRQTLIHKQNKQMINGVRLSQIHNVSLNQLNHYRRVANVQSSGFSRLSQLDDSFVKIVNNRKLNHQRWKKFQQNKFTTDLERKNSNNYKRLHQIMLSTSRYSQEKLTSPRTTKPASFYSRKKEIKIINDRNPEIAKRIINVRGSYDRSKTDMEYKQYRQTVHRLQRFSVFLRMNAREQRRMKLKSLPNERTLKLQDSCSTPKKSQILQKINRYSSTKS